MFLCMLLGLSQFEPRMPYSIPSDFISFKKYLASSPSNLAAAERLPWVVASAFKSNSFLAALSPSRYDCTPGAGVVHPAAIRPGKSSNVTVGPEPSTTARSMTLASSRTLPGQS